MVRPKLRKPEATILLLTAWLVANHGPAAGVALTAATADPRIATMKSSPRGPFKAIRWFCNDGAVLKPTPNACDSHGGGVQHGAWSRATVDLRAAGHRIANIYACLLYTSPSPRDRQKSRMPSSA